MEMVEEGQNQPKIATQLIKFEEIKAKEEEGEDRISLLPDCLLVEILSRLPSTKEAIRTGTLSTRWKHIWTSVPVLIFTYSDLPSSNFVSCVEKTLTQCRQLKLKRFKLSTGFGTRPQINSWIRYAIRRNVEQLYLWLPENSWAWDAKIGDEFGFDETFFISSCFTDLKVESCIWNPSGAISWKNLRSLWITKGDLDEGLIENILSGSPLLETLVLDCCQGFSQLDITSKNVKKLMFLGYGDYEYHGYLGPDDILEINAPNILSLTIKGVLGLWNLLLLNVSSLVEADLDYFIWDWKRKRRQEMLKKLIILNLSQVKELRIGSCCSKGMTCLKDKGFVFPSNIKFAGEIESASENDSETESDSVESGDCWCFEYMLRHFCYRAILSLLF